MQRLVRYMLWIATALAAAIFIFSGFVKVADPWGGAIKIEEYLTIYSLEWLRPASMWLSVALAVGELALGVILLLRVYLKPLSLIFAVVMLIFTTISLLSATLLPIGDCGCFGEAVKLTPWQTVYKNIPLMVVALALLWEQQNREFKFNRVESAVASIVIISTSALAIYTTQNMPLLDFTHYRVGSDIYSKLHQESNSSQSSVKLVYRNIESGKLQEFNIDDLEWRDSSKWEWVETKSSVDNADDILDFALYNSYDEDITDDILTSPHPTTLLIIKGEKSPNHRVVESMQARANQVQANDEDIYIISSQRNIPTELSHIERINIDYTTLKTLFRPSSGYVVFEDGVITQKVRYR